MSHAGTDLALPERGVVVIQGSNGSGKSSLVEAVSVAMFGKTLRGSSPWRDGEAGEVEVCSDLVDAARKRSKGGKTSLAWSAVDPATRAELRLGERDLAGGDDFENATKAQAALESIVGPYDVWRRTAVFSSQDAAHFTQATDGERKRLLESILQLDRFDVALERCRTELRVAENYLGKAERRQEAMVIRVEGAQKALAKAEEDLEHLPAAVDPKKLQTGVDECAAAIRSYDSDIRGARERLRSGERVGADVRAKLTALTRERDRLAGGKCPTCGQGTADLHRFLGRELKGLELRAKEAGEAAEKEAEQLRADLEEMEAEQHTLMEKRARFQADAQAVTRAEEQRQRAEQAARDARCELDEWGSELGSAEEGLAACRVSVAELAACERVLGLKGVRATVLGKALRGVELSANAWLGRIAGRDLRLSLKSYTEKKTGGISDSISLEVEGAGGGNGYRGASGGERRRIDVALLLALADVAAGAAGRESGTLFFDEVFDALDQEGVAAVSAALGDLAKTRAVVVVTHSQQLADTLSGIAVQRLLADGGSVVER